MSAGKQSQLLVVCVVSAALLVWAGGCPVPQQAGATIVSQTDELDETAAESGSSAEIQQSLENTDPHADPGGGQLVYSGDSVRLNGTGSSDPDGDELTYEWSQVAGSPAVEFGGSRFSSIVSFEAPSVARSTTLTFRLQVSDGFASDWAETRVTIRPRG